MLAIFESILPIFLLVLFGQGLKRLRFIDQSVWPGLENLGYYVLFPALLFLTLAEADFSRIEAGKLSATALIAVFALAAALLAAKPALSARGVSDASFTSVFQASTRWNGFIALAVARAIAGETGLAVVALIMAVIIVPINLFNVMVLVRWGQGSRSVSSFLIRIFTNPLILSCIAGIIMNALPFSLYPPLATAIDLVARSALGLGLMMVGAGLVIADALRPRLITVLAVFLKLLAFPVLMLAIAMVFGIDGTELTVLIICAAVPTAMNGYLLARQMGGDAPLYAAAATLQTAFSFFTIPLVLALANALGG